MVRSQHRVRFNLLGDLPVGPNPPRARGDQERPASSLQPSHHTAQVARTARHRGKKAEFPSNSRPTDAQTGTPATSPQSPGLPARHPRTQSPRHPTPRPTPGPQPRVEGRTFEFSFPLPGNAQGRKNSSGAARPGKNTVPAASHPRKPSVVPSAPPTTLCSTP